MKKKLLIENFLIYGLGGVIERIIPIIMLPIITYMLPSEDYFGINDLYNTISSICCTIGLLGMADTLFRFFFDNDDEKYKKSVCSTAFLIMFVGTIFVLFFLIMFRNLIAERVYGSSEYVFLIWFNTFSVLICNMQSVFAVPTKAQNRRKTYVLINFLTPLVLYAVAIFLIKKGWYLSGLPLASLLSMIVMAIIYFIINHDWFSYKNINLLFITKFLKFGIPLMPHHLMYWIINSSDKIMISLLLGQGMNGIYAVASKLGHISQLIYVSFSGGWQYYKYTTMNEDDQIRSNSRIFEYLSIISFTFMGMVCLMSKLIFKILLKNDYYEGYIVTPYLFLAPLILMLFQIVAGQFTIVKKTWPNTLFLLIGTVTNLILNFILIPVLEIEGAAIATLLGYIVTTTLAAIVATKKGMLKLSRKYYVCILFTGLFYLIWRIFQGFWLLTICAFIIMMIVFMLLYRKDFIGLLKRRN